MATVRLSLTGDDSATINLLFASLDIELEIVKDAEDFELTPGLKVPYNKNIAACKRKTAACLRAAVCDPYKNWVKEVPTLAKRLGRGFRCLEKLARSQSRLGKIADCFYKNDTLQPFFMTIDQFPISKIAQ
jgi:hypothetical protein